MQTSVFRVDVMYYDRFKIQLSDQPCSIILIGDEQGIAQLLIDNGTVDMPVTISDQWIHSSTFFKDAKQQLREFFSGQRQTFDLKLNPAGTPFQRAVWEQLCQIPYGELRSYKAVATGLGNPNASRAVGMANNRNPIPIIIPCHRVVGANKKLVGYAYGLELKQHLINHEILNRLFQRLHSHYGELGWWPANDDFEMMVGAILTQNTNWQNVEKALANFQQQLTPQNILAMTHEALAQTIRPSGYFNQKAVRLKALTQWYQGYDFDITKARDMNGDTLRSELLAINGIGPETADSILVYALEQRFFIIDAYTRRILYRVGIDLPKDYDELRILFENAVPDDLAIYQQYHSLLVEHAKAHCTKVPQCNDCPLGEMCEKRWGK